MEPHGSQGESGWLGRLAISIRVRSSSPRTDVLGHSQSSLRDWSRGECTPRTNVLGYSQPSLRDWFRYTLIANLFFSWCYPDRPIKKANLDKTGSPVLIPPSTTCWATLSRPLRQAQGRLFGTEFVNGVLAQTLKPGSLSALYGPTEVVP